MDSRALDFEVVSYINVTTNFISDIVNVSQISYYLVGFKDYTGGFSKQSCFKVNQLKRLSDQSIFSIGEMVDSTWGKQKITGFDITATGVSVCFETCKNPLEKVKKETTVHTTEKNHFIWDTEHVKSLLEYAKGDAANLAKDADNIVTDFIALKQQPELDYDILQAVNKSNSVVLDKQEDGYFRNISSQYNLNRVTLLELCSLDHYYIRKVKRLSDSKIFKLHDVTVMGTIQSIYIQGYVCYIGFEDGFSYRLDCINKPLLITEDGVTVTDRNQILFSVCPFGDWNTRDNLTYNHFKWEKVPENSLRYYKRWKHFANKEARDEYVVLNKPCLSIKDVNGLSTAILNDRQLLIAFIESKKSIK